MVGECQIRCPLCGVREVRASGAIRNRFGAPLWMARPCKPCQTMAHARVVYVALTLDTLEALRVPGPDDDAA